MKLSLIVLVLFGCHAALAREICVRGLRHDTKGAATWKISAGDHFLNNINAAGYTFEIDNPHTPLQHKEELQTMEISERKQLAMAFYYAMVGDCKRQDISCMVCDLVFIAKELVMGDPKCYFTCSGDMIVENAGNLPTDKTLETYLKVGATLKKDSRSNTKLLELINEGREIGGKTLFELNDKKRAIFLFPIVMITMKAIINIGTLYAVNYVANRAKANGEASGQAVQLLGQASKVAAAGGGCFSAMSSVNTKLSSGAIVNKQLKDVNVGDYVESIEPTTGMRVFTQVYYMVHDKQNTSSLLYQVYFKAGGNVESLALSDRHLIYITKQNQPIENPPMDGPIRADQTEIGDWVWVMKGDKLQARQVVDISITRQQVRHPLTKNHHIIVNNVHASVHILNENLYRMLSLPLRFTYWLNPAWNSNAIVHKLVRLVENVKEPFFNNDLGKQMAQFIVPQSMIM